MGGNAERPQHGRGAKGPGFAGFHPNLTLDVTSHGTPTAAAGPWWQLRVRVWVFTLARLGEVCGVLVTFSEGSTVQTMRGGSVTGTEPCCGGQG